jgi:hypothetical protein
MIGFVEIFEQDGNIMLVGAPPHVLAKMPLDALHVESGAKARSSRSRALAVLGGLPG